MGPEDDSRPSGPHSTGAPARTPWRATLAHLSVLLAADGGKPRWATPVLVLLGLASSLAETMGITLVVGLLYAAVGQGTDALGAVNGWWGRGLAELRQWFASPAAMVGAILFLILARVVITHVNRLAQASVGEGISEAVRNRMHERFLTAPYAFIQRHEQAHLMEVLGSETWFVADAYRAWTRIVIGACSIIVFVGFLLALSWPITLTAVVGFVLLGSLVRLLARRAQRLGERVRQTHQTLGEQMLMTIQGLRTIRAYGLEQAHHARFLGSSAVARALALALHRMTAWLDPMGEAGHLAILSVVIAGALHWGVALPVLLAAAALLYRLQPHLRELERNVLQLAQLEPRLRSVRAMLDRGIEGALPPVGTQPARLQRDIRFEMVSFGYGPGAPPALDAVTFTIPAGRTTALVGPSGAGKSTVINLLLRLYEPGAGRILVDGVPLHDLERRSWVAMLGVAGQDIDLIEGTVMDNLRMADATATPEATLDAARIAGVDLFVATLPEAYDTWIGQQGHRFSGGQRQRLGLARALLRRPQLLILDEATNALDDELDLQIRTAIDARFAGCTVLIVSHREATIRAADHVIRLDRGRSVRPAEA